LPAGGHLATGDNTKNVVAGCHATLLPIRHVTAGCHILVYFQIDFIMIRILLVSTTIKPIISLVKNNLKMSKTEESGGISIFNPEYVLLNKNCFRFLPVTSFQTSMSVEFEELTGELSIFSPLIDSIEKFKQFKLPSYIFKYK